ncbi:internal head protein [Pseudomonas phage vB_Pae10145-KEN51]|uniref:PHIKZ096 n=6 Tax=root TaxID=1 RepID=Q8SD66_BPDPK|nr:hypothetical protein [Pseudomonas aeruginosa]NP_803662.1 internal head protein [Pseudomonas phage phiKZ]YP_009617571.1 internal head protein [Pseudomonas phage PA7]YP_009619795.1 internal head protein [Pseudomonas phage SL2]ANM44881.1 putative structural head protein [Pseudomonas phage KTN4]QGK90116.1 putative structural protein [Pseudomonas phage vB_PA32_GUMS]QJB22758.1 hypothetical protein fnug_115 [Pseudomonas phage fnug]QOV07970.1 structural protein [Pseudomonas phage vB_PaeM_kmuB]QY
MELIDIYKDTPDEMIIDLDEPKRLADLLSGDEALARRVMDLLGGMEDYNQIQGVIKELEDVVSTEDISDTIKHVIDRVIKLFVTTIEKLMDSGVVLAATAEYVAIRAENLRVNSRARTRKNKNPTFLITTRIQNLSVRYKPITNSANLLSHLRVLETVVDGYINGLDNVILRPANIIPSYMNPNASPDALAELLLNSAPTKITTPSVYRDQGNRFVSLHLLGNHQIVINYNPDKNASAYDQCRDISSRLVPSEETPRPLPVEIEFEHFNHQVTESIIDRVVKVVDKINRANAASMRTRRNERLRTLKGALIRFRDELTRARNEGRPDREIQELVSLVETYVDWLAIPYHDLFKLTCRNLTAILNVCDENLK